jgi:hypothetical protein
MMRSRFFACLLLLLCSFYGMRRQIFAQSHSHSAASGPATPAEQFLLLAANQERQQRGIAPLAWSSELAAAAYQHAMLMAQQNAISHQFAGEPGLTQRAKEARARFSLIEENVAEAPTASMLHSAWMHSTPHRTNLLNPQVDAVGIAVVERNGELFAVEDFSHQIRSEGYAAQEEQVDAMLTQQGLQILQDSASARRTCATDSGYAGAHRPLFIMRYTTTDLGRIPDVLLSRIRTGRYHSAIAGACSADDGSGFTTYRLAILLY